MPNKDSISELRYHSNNNKDFGNALYSFNKTRVHSAKNRLHRPGKNRIEYGYFKTTYGSRIPIETSSDFYKLYDSFNSILVKPSKKIDIRSKEVLAMFDLLSKTEIDVEDMTELVMLLKKGRAIFSKKLGEYHSRESRKDIKEHIINVNNYVANDRNYSKFDRYFYRDLIKRLFYNDEDFYIDRSLCVRHI